MSAAELAPIIETLSQNEKIRLLQFLVASISRDANISPLDPTVTYPMWTPYNTPVETASTLANMLASEADDN